MKIIDKLCEADYARMIESFRQGTVDSIELVPSIDYNFVKSTPLVLAGTDKEYILTVVISFRDDLGNSVCENAGIRELGITKSPKTLELRLAKPLRDKRELIKDLAYGFLLIETIMNHVVSIHDVSRLDGFIVDSKQITMQIEKSKKERDPRTRNEKFEPFEIVHADNGSELDVQDLVPMYIEYDKFDLFGAKKAFILLPRNFAMKLLRCEQQTLIPEEQFSQKEKIVLNDFVKKKYLKATKVAGKTCYFGLDTKTRMYIARALRSH
jgi:hypothetical protein